MPLCAFSNVWVQVPEALSHTCVQPPSATVRQKWGGAVRHPRSRGTHVT